MTQDKLKIFISYSRKDCAAFAEDLLAGLELLGFAPYLDLHDIAAGEDWQQRLAGLIQSADTMVYAISPQAVQSEVCAWEVDKAISLGKRLIPIIAIPVEDTEVPEPLKRLNYIFFDKPHSTAKALSQLSQALKTDLDWVREHTRLSELATRWEIREKLDAQLLRGAELDAATAWMANWKSGAPDVPDSVRKFIQTSSEAETNRANKERHQLEEMAEAQAAKAKAQAAQEKTLAQQEVTVKKLSRRTTIGLFGVGGLAIAASGLAYWGTDAERRFRAAQKEAEKAATKALEELIQNEAIRTDIVGQVNAFAASPGQLAIGEMEGYQTSPYTTHLLEALNDPDIPFLTACMDASQTVRQKTYEIARHLQRPYLSTDMNGNIYLQRHKANKQQRIAIAISVDSAGRNDKALNTHRDIEAWSDFLSRKCGFEVKRLKNPGLEEIEQTIDAIAFSKNTRQGNSEHPFFRNTALTPTKDFASIREKPELPNTLIMFIYSGNGFQLQGTDYLLTNDAKINDWKSVASNVLNMMPLAKIQHTMRKKAAASILILDTHYEYQDPLSKFLTR